MTAARDELAELLRKARWDAREADTANGYRCGFDPDRFIADAILGGRVARAGTALPNG